MKLARAAMACLALAMTVAAVPSHAERTREEVLRELDDARRMGEINAPGCGGGTLREAFPARYPATPAAATAKPRSKAASVFDPVVAKDARSTEPADSKR